MHHGVCVPNLDEFEDPRRFAELARRAEEAGWDGVFVWDHVVFPFGTPPVADPWVLLTAAAMVTSRVRLGPLVTAVPRRRPGTLARQTTSLDRLSAGRFVLGAGLGFTAEAEYGTWGEPAGLTVLAERLDEGLDLLTRLWSGEAVSFAGAHFTARDVRFAPTPVQRPRPPVWLGCNWPNRAPLRRAARWDGVAPMIFGPDGTMGPTPEIVAEIVSTVGEHRSTDDPFDVVLTGRTEPAAALDTVAPLEAAGATWWLEGFFPGEGEHAAALDRIEAGPPR